MARTLARATILAALASSGSYAGRSDAGDVAAADGGLPMANRSKHSS